MESCPLVSDLHSNDKLALLGATINRLEPDVNSDGQLYPEELVLLKHGHFFRSIQGSAFLWDWMFWAEGREIAADVSPLHFMQNFDLVSVETGKVLASFSIPQSPGEPPDWVKALQKQEASVGERPSPAKDCRFRAPERAKPASR